MNNKESIKQLWREGFGDSDEYLDMYFNRVFPSVDSLEITDDNKVVSSLFCQRFGLSFHGFESTMSYLAGAVTHRKSRGRGYMSQLVTDALRLAMGRGDVLCAVMPAHHWLYGFFSRFGFTPVFLADVQRFTSRHPFPTTYEYHDVSDHYASEVYNAFAAMERMNDGVLHSQRDFLNVLDDLAMRPGGRFVVVGREGVPVAGMAWAMDDGDLVRVNEVLGVDEDARTGALCALRRDFPDKPFSVLAAVDDSRHRHLRPRGMGRLVDVGKCLGIIAAANPVWKSAIRVYDRLLSGNSGTYVVSDGVCRKSDCYSARIDMDVTVEVLSKIVFSSSSIGEILDFPSQRARLSLMLH